MEKGEVSECSGRLWEREIRPSVETSLHLEGEEERSQAGRCPRPSKPLELGGQEEGMGVVVKRMAARGRRSAGGTQLRLPGETCRL